MRYLKKNFIITLFFIVNCPQSALTDNYPKNPKIDALNYIFKLELSDHTDEILCETTIEVKFLGTYVKKLRTGKGLLQRELGIEIARIQFPCRFSLCSSSTI